MRIAVNGNDREVPSLATLADLLAHLGIPADRPGTAVARNGEVVPRARWSATAIAEGDRFEIITAVQGG